MKVSRVDKIMEIYNTSKMKKTEKAKKTEGKDTVALSNQGKDYQKALKAVSKVPDIREEKVEEIKQRIQSGNYDISAEELAEKIVDSIFDMKI
ncbi:MAG: flagellar biosynthesis anti-sigma factor FlgM [Epulopiscium sp.]|jgi:negative regulator of flagellin synthesis FlgM|nr:flagellar biosynthesis anti-sigma factor FlgM [Candidatus Epulonipiscium sp.]